MSRRALLTDSERDSLFALPDNQADLIRYYSFSESDLSVIPQHRGAAKKRDRRSLRCSPISCLMNWTRSWDERGIVFVAMLMIATFTTNRRRQENG